MKQSRIKLWMFGALAPLAPLLLLGGFLASINISGNFHPVVAGELYRSAQPTPARIADYKSKYGIATIVNLRGENQHHSWYRDEVAASRRLGIAYVDFRMSAKHELSREKAAELISILKTAKKPILIHCHSGSDRSGLAAAIYLAATGHGEDAAEAQLSWRFGHLGIPLLSSTYSMDATFERLEPWLGFPHSSTIPPAKLPANGNAREGWLVFCYHRPRDAPVADHRTAREKGNPPMDRVTFGTSNLSVSPLGLGCYSMSGAYGPQNDDECIATIHRALDLGINFLDTSSNYGRGHNQILIGKAIKGKRDQFVIHSKLGSIRPDGVNVVSGTPDHIRASCEGGLRRLGIDCVDVICISRIDPVTPIEESVGAMAKLVEEGKTRFIALSKDVTPDLLDRALAVHPIVSVQDEYSLFARAPEDELLPTVRAKGLAFMAFAPLGRGLLGGGLRAAADIPEGDERRNDERFQGDNIQRNAAIVDALGDMAAEKGVTVAALVLAWLMHRDGQVIPIPSAKTRAHLEENAKALSLKFSAADLARIEDICPRDAIAGRSFYDKPAAAS